MGGCTARRTANAKNICYLLPINVRLQVSFKSRSRTMQIGELARRAGVHASALRYYDTIGLIVPEERVGGRRVYSEAALQRLAVIVMAKELGFTLAEIRELFGGFVVRRWKLKPVFSRTRTEAALPTSTAETIRGSLSSRNP